MIALLCSVGVLAAEPPPKLTPGGRFTVNFPGMPPTFSDLLQHRSVGARMTVFLPNDYDSARRHPLLIFLSGGDGGNGGDPWVARALCQERDFVCVNLPLFKQTLAPPGAATTRERILIRDADARFAWPLYRAMLDRLEALVPNIDPNRRVLGGFSNGAHMTAGLIQESDGEVARYFCAFLLGDGGGGLKEFELIKGKALLMVCGVWRPDPMPPTDAGVRLTIHRMKEAVHAFPQSEYPAVRQWLRGPAMEQRP